LANGTFDGPLAKGERLNTAVNTQASWRASHIARPTRRSPWIGPRTWPRKRCHSQENSKDSWSHQCCGAGAI